jgi:hypothetical protein
MIGIGDWMSRSRAGVSVGLGETGAPAPSPALDLDFRNATYKAGGTTYASLALVPGYAYSRSGAKGEPNGAGSAVTAFAANAPGILAGEGYYSRAACTNLLLRSQELDNAAWIKSLSVTSTAITAPNGTGTADKASLALGQIARQDVTGATAGGIYTFSAFVRKPSSGGAASSRLTTNNAAAFGTGASVETTLTSNWQRAVLTGALSTGTTIRAIFGAVDAAGASDADCTGDVEVWQLQLVAGAHAGPIIPTTAAAATIGADSLAFAVANGGYEATFTFDNGSTQVIAVTVAAGVYTLPVHPTALNRPLVRRLVLEAV